MFLLITWEFAQSYAILFKGKISCFGPLIHPSPTLSTLPGDPTLD